MEKQALKLQMPALKMDQVKPVINVHNSYDSHGRGLKATEETNQTI
jgi:hypothetical protein